MNFSDPGHPTSNGQPPLAGLLHLPAFLLATASQVFPKPGYRAKDRLKYILRGLASARLTAAWFQLLQEPSLAPFARLNPRILSKLQRPYAQSHLRTAVRLKILQEHYRFALGSFTATTFPDLLRRPGIILAEMPVDDAGPFSLRLLYANKFEKEGELTVALHDGGQREFMFALSFCICSFRPNPCEIFIGGLQGYQIANQRERVVAITRAMRGLRPKSLLVFAVQELAGLWRIPTIRAVGDTNAVFRDSLNTQVIHASYDQFWLECGGQQGPDGNFMLPARFVPRDLMKLKPTKRKLYRRRYEMLAELGTQMRQRAIQISSNGATWQDKTDAAVANPPWRQG
jgi:uncharacterized protein